ncbi:MAG TPA: PDZ domain-containing protein [Pseudonocardiaceae bacterium]|nr:PDZ domain-containing protein [Pseudonocardiaceae bacterium]
MSERGEAEASERGEAQAEVEAQADAATTATAGTAATRTPTDRHRGMTRRRWTLLFSGVLVVVLGLVGGFVQVPYVALGPGPTYDTLSAVNGQQIIQVNGTATHATSGELRMVTVSEIDQITLFGALGLWMSGNYALQPRELYFPPGQSQQAVNQQNVQEFQESQIDAEVSALRYLHYPIEVVTTQVVDGSPADKLIKAGDKIVSVNGKTVTSAEDVVNALANTKPGQTVPVSVQTGSQPVRDLHITLGKNPSGAPQGFIGIQPAAQAVVPFKINVSLTDIGGPSAGLIFALAIVDKLTNSDVNGGMKVAGTGEIDDLGNVSEIGGIPFKLVAARAAGATVFLTPADNCAEAKAHVPAGLRLVKVTSLSSAISELAALKAGRPVPGC